jgi:hypothetical protein
MKILEAQSAQLTNYEVFTHLTELKAKSNARKGNRALGRAPGNLETVVKEVRLDADVDAAAEAQHHLVFIADHTPHRYWITSMRLPHLSAPSPSRTTATPLRGFLQGYGNSDSQKPRLL